MLGNGHTLEIHLAVWDKDSLGKLYGVIQERVVMSASVRPRTCASEVINLLFVHMCDSPTACWLA